MPKLKFREWLILILSSLAVGLGGFRIGLGLKYDPAVLAIVSAFAAISFFCLTLLLIKQAEKSGKTE